MAHSDQFIVWTDVETTGVEYGDPLLEVACLITDTKLNLLDEDGYEAVIYYPVSEVEKMKAQADEFVVNMHTTSGLWDKLPHGVEKHVVEWELTEYLARFTLERNKARLAGNSVRLDLNALQAHLPQFYSQLHYRSIDVTALATMAEWAGNVPILQKEKKHEAMEDIKESLSELKYLLSHTKYI